MNKKFINFILPVLLTSSVYAVKEEEKAVAQQAQAASGNISEQIGAALPQENSEGGNPPQTNRDVQQLETAAQKEAVAQQVIQGQKEIAPGQTTQEQKEIAPGQATQEQKEELSPEAMVLQQLQQLQWDRRSAAFPVSSFFTNSKLSPLPSAKQAGLLGAFFNIFFENEPKKAKNS